MRQFFVCLFLSSIFALHAEDKFAKKGEAWAIWEKFEKHAIEGEEKEALELVSGILHQTFKKSGIKRAGEEFKNNPAEFVREFEAKGNRYLVIRSNKQIVSLTLTKIGDKWTVNMVNPVDMKGPKDIDKPLNIQAALNKARQKAKLAIVKSNLKQIGTAVAVYFVDIDDEENLIIPDPDAMEIDKEIRTYEHPETGKRHKFLIVKGVEYNGSADELLAVTDVKILGSYWAVFDDGHVSSITDQDFENHKALLGLVKKTPKNVKYSEEEKKKLSDLIAQLGAGKFRERKAARKSLVEKGARIISFLEANEKQKDFEITVSIREIIKELSPKPFSGKRPKVNN